jgi:hypothetical protein
MALVTPTVKQRAVFYYPVKGIHPLHIILRSATTRRVLFDLSQKYREFEKKVGRTKEKRTQVKEHSQFTLAILQNCVSRSISGPSV